MTREALRMNRQNDDWIERYGRIDWRDARSAHRQCRALARHIGENKALLSQLVNDLEVDEARFARCEMHPLMYRLVLHEDLGQEYQVRLHVVAEEARDIVPHDHKYTFSAYILAGGYLHIWNRRLGAHEGDFTSHDITPGIVAIERRGAAYTFRNSLIHQTIMTPGTVSIFIRGPKSQSHWHAAKDMYHLLADGYEVPKTGGKNHKGGRRLTIEEYRRVREQLVSQGLIESRRILDA
ncbi:hypothetical protein [Nonomuraea sp. NPDC049129]|uniref:hypothetical protein n=1 Tax=Nonomuraea sp. NPDC049129 TaxID=3155272 RepID=UPI0033F088F9